ncbi:hypothetical protein [Vampirovibrio sp.]|uniref:hypothetical protein n=1 Tax=Vampirovibrio sp. TaxID=2717857 RepID=UPI0035948D0D
MNLWPFSKKNDTDPSHHFGNPHSGKMELPPGVKLAAPEELEAPASQAALNQQAAPAPLAPATEAAAEAMAPPEHSFEDLTHVPATKEKDPSAEKTEVAHSQVDLNHFCEQNQLKMVVQNPLPELKTVAPQAPQNGETRAAMPNAMASASPVIPTPQSLQREADLAEFFSANHLSTEVVDSAPPPLDFFSDLGTQFNQTPAEPVNNPASQATTPEVTRLESIFPAPETPPALETEANFDSFFLAPMAPDNEPLQPTDSFWTESEMLAVESLQPATPVEAEAAAVEYAIEEAYLEEETQTELPQQLNLPNEALAPNGTNNFLMEAELHPLPETVYLGDDLMGTELNDEPFDLDSILLGNIPAPQLAPAALPQRPSQSIVEESDHYFGDEAEGLKNNDNLESYELGHYEDPDQALETFSLDETPGPLAESIAYDSYYTDSDSDLSFASLQLEELPLALVEDEEETEEKVEEKAEEKKEEPVEAIEPPAFGPAPRLPEHKVEALQPKPSPTQAPPPKAPPMKKTPALRPTFPEAQAHRSGSFEQEILLKNSQFVHQSIDHLVNSYFRHQDQEAS